MSGDEEVVEVVEEVDVDYQLVREVCSECFTERAASGACMCIHLDQNA